MTVVLCNLQISELGCSKSHREASDILESTFYARYVYHARIYPKKKKKLKQDILLSSRLPAWRKIRHHIRHAVYIIDRRNGL